MCLTKAKAVSLIKGPKDKPIKLVILRVNEAGKKEKINVRLVIDTFKVPKKTIYMIVI